MKAEIVYTIDEFLDCPRKGIADFLGKPYIYECVFSKEKDDYTDRFRLIEISEETLNLYLKNDKREKDWDYSPIKLISELHTGILDKDKDLYEKQKIDLDSLLLTDSSEAIYVKGKFNRFSLGCWVGYVVEWER